MELAHSTGALPPGYQAHNVIAEAQLRDTEAAATLSVARKASRERAELEKRHYEECQALAQESSRLHEEAKQKETALRGRLQGKETALAEATADSRRYRRKYAEAQAELEATRSYAQQLLANQPIAPSVRAADETDLVTDANALAVEVARLQAANEELESNLQARSEQLTRERAVHQSVLSAQAVQHERVLSLEASLAEAHARVADTRRRLECERVALGRLKRTQTPTHQPSPVSMPSSPVEKSPMDICSSASQTEPSLEASPLADSTPTTEAKESTAPRHLACCLLLSQALRSQIQRRLSRSISAWRVAASRIGAASEARARKLDHPASSESQAELEKDGGLRRGEDAALQKDEERALLETAQQTAVSLEVKLAAADARADAAETELKAAHVLLEKATAAAVDTPQAHADLVQAGASAAIDAFVANQVAVAAAEPSASSLSQPPPSSCSKSTSSFLAVAASSASESLLLAFTFNAWKDAHLRAVITVLAKAVSASVGPSLTAAVETSSAPLQVSTGANLAPAECPTDSRGSIVELYGSLNPQVYQLPHLRWRLSAATGTSFFADPIPATPHHTLTALTIARYSSLTINDSFGAESAPMRRAIAASDARTSEGLGITEDQRRRGETTLDGTTTTAMRYLEASAAERHNINARATSAAAQATSAASSAAAEISQALTKDNALHHLDSSSAEPAAVSNEDLTVFMACLRDRILNRSACVDDNNDDDNSSGIAFNVDQFKDALRYLRRNEWEISASTESGISTPAEDGGSARKSAMEASHRVLRQLEVFMKAERWRVTDLYNHIDALGLGTITFSELRKGLIDWGVLSGECSHQSTMPHQLSARDERQALRGTQTLTPTAASAVAAAGAAASRAATAAAMARRDVEEKMRTAAATEAAAKEKRESEAATMANMRAAREAAARVTAAQERAKRAEASAAANELFLESMQSAYEYTAEDGNCYNGADFENNQESERGPLPEEWSDPEIGFRQGAFVREDEKPRGYGFSSRDSSVPRRSSSALSSHDKSSRERVPPAVEAAAVDFNNEETSRRSAHFSYMQPLSAGRPPLRAPTSVQPPRVTPFPRASRPSASRLSSRSRDSSPSASYHEHHGVDGDAESGVETLEALMGSLRARLAEEVYLVSESLFASLECDFREVRSTRHSRHNATTSSSRQPTPVDTSHLKRFHSKLSAAAGPLQALMLVYLRTYESLRAVLHHRAQRRLGLPHDSDAALPAPLHHTLSSSSSSSSRDPLIASGVLLGDAHCPLDPFPEPPGDSLLAKRSNAILPNLKELWHKQRRGTSTANARSDVSHDDNDYGERAFTTAIASGKKPSTKAKAALAREQTEQLTYLPGDKEGYRQVCSHAKARSGCAHCTAKANRDTRVRSKLGYSEGGASPSDFWSLVGGALPEAKKNPKASQGGVPLEKLEGLLWRLALLVRCQDRDKGLKLYRQESMRETLDVRFYEVLLLYLRSTLQTSGAVREAKDGLTLRFKSSSRHTSKALSGLAEH